MRPREAGGASARAPGERGFTLIECLVALALLGVAMVVAAAAVTAQVRHVERVEARQRMLGAVANALESVRGGALPLGPTSATEFAQGGSAAVTEIRWSVDVRPGRRAGLYEVTAHAACELRGETLHLAVSTMVWRP